jgi:hypothetical protein
MDHTDRPKWGFWRSGMYARAILRTITGVAWAVLDGSFRSGPCLRGACQGLPSCQCPVTGVLDTQCFEQSRAHYKRGSGDEKERMLLVLPSSEVPIERSYTQLLPSLFGKWLSHLYA